MLQFKTKKQIYKCGHEVKPILIDNNEISMSAVFEWQETTGFDGDMSKCWECWCRGN